MEGDTPYLTITLRFLPPLKWGVSTARARDPEPTITFLGWEVVSNGIKFSYQVTSGSKPSLSHWDLYSCRFVEGALVDVSESPYEYKPEDTLLKFDKGYEDGETRTVWFILDLDYYSALIGWLDYEWKAGGDTGDGRVLGPICNPDFVIPETSFGTLGAIIPLMIAAGLLMAKKNNFFTIKIN
jgi:hypothetical protein